MDVYELGDLITFGPSNGLYKSEEFIGSGTLLLDIKSLYRGFTADFSEARRVQITEKEQKKYEVLRGDILINRVSKKPGGVGKAVLVSEVEEPTVYESNMMRFRVDTTKVIPRFLVQYLASDMSRQELLSKANISNQASINQETVKSLKVILPSLVEQKRIAAIAQKADRLRRTRRYALQLGDTYLQSVFLEMFGAQQPSFERMTLSEVCLKIFDCKHYTPPYVPEGIPLIKTNDVVPGFFQFGNTVYVSPEEYEKLTDVNKPEQGDIVFAREGSFGVASYIADNRKYAIGQRMMLLRADKRQVNPIYLTHFLNSPPTQENLLKVSMGTTVQRVNVGDVKDLPVSVPPLPLQEKFAQIVQQFERLRAQQREGDRQAEHLFQTLLHRAFRGELTPQESNDEPASVLLEEIGAEQAKAEAEAKAATQMMGDTAEYLGTKAKQQDTEPIQLTLPGLE
ncbi:restriction endonuclease subunit S [Coleofasciculus sp. FACHB-T130]|uniref:restriction endonuclease subunit S n=1 Tax=Cyanophyceae TaxID=3028117 RepID=UPI001684FE93|nr:restriction endonuclease subunit S [Coleofasciculus sp. FACHB-T130]MBD1881255.1 restriction endonuclease subunit S [Coleofasciculus sp. FACHB-T130]